MTEEERERIRQRVVWHLQLQAGDDLERDVEVLAATDILWCAWECDYQAVLFRQLPDRQPELCVIGGVTVALDGFLETLQERIAAYRKAIRDTEAFIAQAKGLPPPEPGREWRWCCMLCGTEGKGGEPKACPTCGATDAWYNYKTTSDDTEPAMARLRNLLKPKAGK